MHIGSQIIDLDAVRGRLRAVVRIRAHAARVTATKFPMSISAAVSAFPIATTEEAPPLPEAYADVVKRATKGLGCKLIFEPGRLIVGNAGILVTRVIYLKRGEAKTFVIVDAAMNDLVRPTLYEAHHDILPVRRGVSAARRSPPTLSARCARPATIWRSTGTWPEPKPGDLIAIMTSGAYGAVQAGTYNTRALDPGSFSQRRRVGAGAATRRSGRADRDGPLAKVALTAAEIVWTLTRWRDCVAFLPHRAAIVRFGV